MSISASGGRGRSTTCLATFTQANVSSIPEASTARLHDPAPRSSAITATATATSTSQRVAERRSDLGEVDERRVLGLHGPVVDLRSPAASDQVGDRDPVADVGERADGGDRAAGWSARARAGPASGARGRSAPARGARTRTGAAGAGRAGRAPATARPRSARGSPRRGSGARARRARRSTLMTSPSPNAPALAISSTRSRLCQKT